MIDIGLNLTSSQFAGEQPELVARARVAGVEALILTGTDLAGSRESAELAARWPGYCFSTAGVHPHDAKSVDEATLPALRELAALPQVVAIGECGLDYNRDFSPVRCRMRYSTPSWHWLLSSGCRCFSTAAMRTPVLSRSSVPGCRNYREPCCTASPVPTRSWTSVWRWGCISG